MTGARWDPPRFLGFYDKKETRLPLKQRKEFVALSERRRKFPGDEDLGREIACVEKSAHA